MTQPPIIFPTHIIQVDSDDQQSSWLQDTHDYSSCILSVKHSQLAVISSLYLIPFNWPHHLKSQILCVKRWTSIRTPPETFRLPPPLTTWLRRLRQNLLNILSFRFRVFETALVEKRKMPLNNNLNLVRLLSSGSSSFIWFVSEVLTYVAPKGKT